MDLTSAIGSLGGDYVNKVTSAMKENASLSTSKSKDSDTTFDAIYDSVAGGFDFPEGSTFLIRAAGRDRLCSWQYD